MGAVVTAVTLRRRSARPVGRALVGGRPDMDERTRARELLDDRYAAGQINSDEYRERLITLEQGG
jgi:uncharacterized membrane protein